MNRFRPLIVLAIGAVATAWVALSLSMSLQDAVQIGGTAGLGALAAGAIGALTLRWARRGPMGLQIVVVALTCLAAVAAGAAAAANSMFISSHDLHSLWVVLTASGTVGVAIALFLGRRVARAGRILSDATDRLGAGDVLGRVATGSGEELEELGRRLENVSKHLDESRRRERALEASRRELVAWVSHDLRTPLSGIRAMSEALEDGIVDDPETVARYHTTIRGESERLAGLVDDLFELSSIHAGTLRLEMERASLGDLVSDALAAASATARARRVHLEGVLITEAPEVDLSIAEMGRVLRNLLENAIRHTPGDGTVTVEAGIEGDSAFFAVADSCGGIPAGDIDRVFDVAFTGRSARAPDEGRGGLGLAIARGIVEAHHGRITVNNANAGCRFTVTLPLVKAAE